MLVASVENAGKIPPLNELHGGVAEGFFRGPAPVPESMILVKTGFLDHDVTAFFLRLMQSVEMWRNCVVGAYTVVWEHAATALLLQTRQGRNC